VNRALLRAGRAGRVQAGKGSNRNAYEAQPSIFGEKMFSWKMLPIWKNRPVYQRVIIYENNVTSDQKSVNDPAF
jgi:hypothetical protein